MLESAGRWKKRNVVQGWSRNLAAISPPRDDNWCLNMMCGSLNAPAPTAATWRRRMSRWNKKRQEFSRSDEIAEWCRWSSPQDAEMTSTLMMLSHWWKDATTELLHWWSRDEGNGKGSQKDAPMVVKQGLRRREEQSSGLSADSRRMINDEAANARVRWTPRKLSH